MTCGFPTDFSMVSCPNRVLTPLKVRRASAFEVEVAFHLLFLTTESSFGERKVHGSHWQATILEGTTDDTMYGWAVERNVR